VAANSLKLTVDSAVTASFAIAGTPPSDDKADECSDPGADGYSLVGVLMHGFVGGLRGLDCLVADPTRNFFAVFQCGGQTLAGFPDFFSGHIGCRGYQGARVFDERTHVIGGCVCMSVHNLLLSLFICAFRR
jgi:hypothetical protein